MTRTFLATLLAVVALAACSEGAKDDVPSKPTPPATTTTEAAPMQSWMKANASTAMTAGDNERLEKAMARLSELAPAGYDRWSELSRAGAAAAKKGDTQAVRVVCKECHELHRDRYRRERRSAPLP